MKKKIPPLYVERASDTGNSFFLSVLEHRKQNYLVVIDNITAEEVTAYVLDVAPQAGLDLSQLITAITYWFYRASDRYPLSFEFSRLGISALTNRIYRTFELGHVTRLIGQDFVYEMAAAPKVRRRRANKIPAGIEIKLRRSQVVQLPQRSQEPLFKPTVEID